MSPEGGDFPSACSQWPAEAPCWWAGPAWRLLLRFHPLLQGRWDGRSFQCASLHPSSIIQPRYSALLVQIWVLYRTAIFSLFPSKEFLTSVSQTEHLYHNPLDSIPSAEWGSGVSIFNKQLRWFAFILNDTNLYSSSLFQTLLLSAY